MSIGLSESTAQTKRTGWLNGRVVLVAALLLAVWAGYAMFLRKHPLEGKTAPPFTAPMLDGAVFDMAEHLGKNPILLDFWAAWCPPCREALPKIADAAAQYAPQGLVVCAVNIGEEPATINGFLSARSLELPVALDEDSRVASMYNVRFLPTLVFIDRDGTIKHVRTGAVSESELERNIRKIL